MREERINKVDTNREWILETVGVNLAEVMLLPEVDCSRTCSNDVIEVFSMLGIEAARHIFLQQIREVFEYHGILINYRHFSLLADVVTHTGIPRSIRECNVASPLMRCRYSEPATLLSEAAVIERKCAMKTIEECVMMGQLATFGTAHCDVLPKFIKKQ